MKIARVGVSQSASDALDRLERILQQFNRPQNSQPEQETTEAHTRAAGKQPSEVSPRPAKVAGDFLAREYPRGVAAPGQASCPRAAGQARARSRSRFEVMPELRSSHPPNRCLSSISGGRRHEHPIAFLRQGEPDIATGVLEVGTQVCHSLRGGQRQPSSESLLSEFGAGVDHPGRPAGMTAVRGGRSGTGGLPRPPQHRPPPQLRLRFGVHPNGPLRSGS